MEYSRIDCFVLYLAYHNSGVISPFKSQNLLCWNSNLLYLFLFSFDLFFLDYFVTFSVGFRLSVHLELTSKSGDQKLLKDLC